MSKLSWKFRPEFSVTAGKTAQRDYDCELGLRQSKYPIFPILTNDRGPESAQGHTGLRSCGLRKLLPVPGAKQLRGQSFPYAHSRYCVSSPAGQNNRKTPKMLPTRRSATMAKSTSVRGKRQTRCTVVRAAYLQSEKAGARRVSRYGPICSCLVSRRCIAGRHRTLRRPRKDLFPKNCAERRDLKPRRGAAGAAEPTVARGFAGAMRFESARWRSSGPSADRAARVRRRSRRPARRQTTGRVAIRRARGRRR